MFEQWQVTAEAVFSVFAVIAAGAVFRKVGWLTEEADESLLRLVVNVLLPALIFDNVVRSDAFTDVSNIWVPPLVGYMTVGVGILVALGFSRLGRRTTGLLTPRSVGTFALCIGLFNYGFIPIPLVQKLFDDRTLGVLFMHNQGVELAIWTIGVLVVSGTLGNRWYKKLINAPAIAIIIALTINLLGLQSYIPAFLVNAIHWLGVAAIPLSMTLIGATIADQIRPKRSESDEIEKKSVLSASSAKTIFWGVAIRLGILPLLFIATAVYMPISPELRRVMIIQAAMPSAVFTIVMARHFGGDSPTALRVVLSNSLLGLITIPLWIVIGARWAGIVLGGATP
jgi:predicted permease